MIYRIEVVAYCIEPDCRCDHRHGVLVYDGGSPAEALQARRECVYDRPGYRIEYRRSTQLAGRRTRLPDFDSHRTPPYAY